MYVEKDSSGRIIIQDISHKEAEILDDCICTYLVGPVNDRSETDFTLIKLKKELEKLI